MIESSGESKQFAKLSTCQITNLTFLKSCYLAGFFFVVKLQVFIQVFLPVIILVFLKRIALLHFYMYFYREIPTFACKNEPKSQAFLHQKTCIFVNTPPVFNRTIAPIFAPENRKQTNKQIIYRPKIENGKFFFAGNESEKQKKTPAFTEKNSS